MKTTLFQSFVILFLLVPSFAFAAFNDLTLTTSTNLSVGGYTLNITGSSAVVQTITVNTSSFSVTLLSGSNISVSSATKQVLSTDAPAVNITGDVCTSASTLTLGSSSGTVVVTVTPSASICTVSASGNAVASSGSSGGGGNGPPVGLLGQQTQNVSAPTASTTIKVASSVSTPTTTPAVSSKYKFSRSLSYRMTNPDVRELQKYLNTHGFVIAPSGVGSPGKESNYFGLLTRTALIKFQESHASEILAPTGLSKGTGYFGPSTRAFLNQ